MIDIIQAIQETRTARPYGLNTVRTSAPPSSPRVGAW